MKEIGRFTIGGTISGPSIPPQWLQRVLGNEIQIDIQKHILYVPTASGVIPVIQGDTIVYYGNGIYEVKRRNDNRGGSYNSGLGCFTGCSFE